MELPKFEHFVIDVSEFLTRLGIVFDPAIENRWNCESIHETDTLLFLGSVCERKVQKSPTGTNDSKNQEREADILIFAISFVKEIVVDSSFLNLYLKHIQDSCGGSSVIVLFYYENQKDSSTKYIALGTVKEQKSGLNKSALIAHIHISNPSRGHLLALEYIQKKIQKTSINSHNAFCECWHELFFERGILNYITKNISDEIQDWYMRSLERVCSDNDKKVNIQEIQMILHRLLICILTYFQIREEHRYKEFDFLQNIDLFRNIENFLTFVKQRIPSLYLILFDEKLQNKVFVSDVLFFGDIENSGLIEILQSYPFTTTENTIYQQEVSLNPEFLGHVYENILTIKRKQTGSFYTSQDLVHYMIEEALIGYFRVQLLKGKYDADIWIEEKIRPLIVDDEKIECNDTEKEMLLRWALSCKIIDPSCGCGAFVIGALQKIQSIIRRLDSDGLMVKRLSVKKYWLSDSTNIQDLILHNCLYGVDIQPLAVQITKIRSMLLRGKYFEHCNTDWAENFWIGNALYMCDSREDFFDIVIGNPPYVGHKGGQKEFFREFQKTQLGNKYNQERMDLFYYFFHLGIQITNQTGIICFLTTNYYPTVDSAVKLRKHIIEETIPFLFVDCNEYELFSSAPSQHNLMTFLCKTQICSTIKIMNLIKKKRDSYHSLRHILRNETSEVRVWNCKNDQYVEPSTGFFLLKEQNPYIDILRTLGMESLKELFHVSQGMVTGADKVKKKHAFTNRHYENAVGEGIFVVPTSFFVRLPKEEQVLLKRWFKNSDITRFSLSDKKLGSYVIQLTSDTELSNYPTIQKHIFKYKEIILGRNYDSGELKKAKKKGYWWALSSSRKEFDFSQPKILVPYRQKQNIIGYTREEYCASADVFFITQKKSNTSISLEVLLLLLNSKLFFLHLYAKGRRKGALLELYKTPLEAIPLPKLSSYEHLVFDRLSKSIILLEGQKSDSGILQKVGEFLILEHYFCKNKDNDMSILSIVHQALESIFEKMDIDQRIQELQKMSARWKLVNSLVSQSMKNFTSKHSQLCASIFSKIDS